ncbi:hypothetical protein PR003_g19811 [Phytophthora rubi]|uniref:RxLR effector protein n=1 Tax=Phytophthora rubi TaxID=129364 RepID=A0A6A3K7N8_9STRA|nr:hypothetical protein PR002_g19293 [Phytophthora rubi]KAE8999863.1 hypothetical protein PR001_g18940 [Phytophthora rubi]KAE9312251.1 hypothetical protein PR003_g19811 [Phytophthora rubi]
MSGHCITVLVVVTLLACINVVPAASMSMGVVSNSDTLGTLETLSRTPTIYQPRGS